LSIAARILSSGNRNAIARRNYFDARADLALGVPEVFHRGKVERRSDDFVATGFEIETRCDGGECDEAFGWI
jgi:hypothetical protein